MHEQQFMLVHSNLSKFCHSDNLALANGLRLGLRWPPGKGLSANDPTLDLLFASSKAVKSILRVPKLFEPTDQFLKALSLRWFFWFDPLVLVNTCCQESFYYDTLYYILLIMARHATRLTIVWLDS